MSRHEQTFFKAAYEINLVIYIAKAKLKMEALLGKLLGNSKANKSYFFSANIYVHGHGLSQARYCKYRVSAITRT